MSQVTIPNTFSTGQPANPTQVNSNFSALANAMNGNLGDSNVNVNEPLQPNKISGTALVGSNLKTYNSYNIIFNPFLIGLTSPLYVRQWVLNTNATLTLNDTTATWGINSVHDANASDTWVMQQTIGTNLNTTLLQSDLHLEPGQTYIVSAWVKTASGSSTVYLASQNATTYASGNTNLNNAGNTVYHTGDGTWQQIYSIFTVPASCQQINIALVKPGNTTDVAISAVSLTLGSLPVPVQHTTHELTNGTTAPDLNINNFGLSDYVVSGLTIPTSASLTATMAAGVAFLNGIQLAVPTDNGHLYTASQDTYVDINKYTLKPTYNPVANNANAPALTANSIRVAKVISSGTAITSVVQSGFDSNYVWIYPTSPIQNISPLQFAQMKYKMKASLIGGTQVLANNVEAPLNLDTIVYDPNNNFNVSTHTWTCPVTGYYLINNGAHIQAASSVNGARNFYPKKNGSAIIYSVASLPTSSTSDVYGCAGTIEKINAGDTIQLMGFQTSGGNLTVNNDNSTFFAIHFLSF